MAAADFYAMCAHELRCTLDALYADYAGCLNDEAFEQWPDFFTADCVYRIIPRENFERGLPLATWHCENRAYLRDRVTAIRNTMIYAPRHVRRMVTGLRILGWRDGVLETRACYLAVQTLLDEHTRIFNAGEYHDKLVVEEGRLKFREKLCVFDSVLIPNSLIYPL